VSLKPLFYNLFQNFLIASSNNDALSMIVLSAQITFHSIINSNFNRIFIGKSALFENIQIVREDCDYEGNTSEVVEMPV
jgi:hypothetical protein